MDTSAREKAGDDRAANGCGDTSELVNAAQRKAVALDAAAADRYAKAFRPSWAPLESEVEQPVVSGPAGTLRPRRLDLSSDVPAAAELGFSLAGHRQRARNLFNAGLALAVFAGLGYWAVDDMFLRANAGATVPATAADDPLLALAAEQDFAADPVPPSAQPADASDKRETSQAAATRAPDSAPIVTAEPSTSATASGQAPTAAADALPAAELRVNDQPAAAAASGQAPTADLHTNALASTASAAASGQAPTAAADARPTATLHANAQAPVATPVNATPRAASAASVTPNTSAAAPAIASAASTSTPTAAVATEGAAQLAAADALHRSTQAARVESAHVGPAIGSNATSSHAASSAPKPAIDHNDSAQAVRARDEDGPNATAADAIPEPPHITTVTADAEAVPPADTAQQRVRAPLVIVRALPEHSKLWLDGQRMANPFDVRLPRGSTHTIDARSRGYESMTQTVRIDSDAKLTITLRRATPAPNGAETPPPADKPLATRTPAAGFVTTNPY